MKNAQLIHRQTEYLMKTTRFSKNLGDKHQSDKIPEMQEQAGYKGAK